MMKSVPRKRNAVHVIFHSLALNISVSKSKSVSIPIGVVFFGSTLSFTLFAACAANTAHTHEHTVGTGGLSIMSAVS